MHFEDEIARAHRRAAEFDSVLFSIGGLGSDANGQRGVDRRQRLRREFDVDDVSENLNDFTGGCHLASSVLRLV